MLYSGYPYIIFILPFLKKWIQIRMFTQRKLLTKVRVFLNAFGKDISSNFALLTNCKKSQFYTSNLFMMYDIRMTKYSMHIGKTFNFQHKVHSVILVMVFYITFMLFYQVLRLLIVTLIYFKFKVIKYKPNYLEYDLNNFQKIMTLFNHCQTKSSYR